MKKYIMQVYDVIERATRYFPENEVRWMKLRDQYSKVRKYFGKKVLDVACGGGVLCFILEADGKNCVGVDISPKMIKAAKKYALESKSKCVFIEANAINEPFDETFDTVSIVGNALCHFTVSDFEKMMNNLEKNVKKGGTFVVDYRDCIKLFYDGSWLKKISQDREGETVVTEDECVDTEKGIVANRAWTVGGKKMKSYQTLWSPFILEALMKQRGWKLVFRAPEPEWKGWLDVYKKEK